MKKNNTFKNLEQQINKIRKHNRQGSKLTKQRYYESTKRFSRFIGQKFGTQKFTNISSKHLAKYVEHLKNEGRSMAHIKTELSAIRFFHDKTSDPKYQLGDNSNFNLEKRDIIRGDINKAWNNQEFNRYKELCRERGQIRNEATATLARNEGLRIHETLKIDKKQAQKAIQENELMIKGKGGKIRIVPLSSESKEILQKITNNTERGQKLFVAPEEKTHLTIKAIQNHINYNRGKFQDEDRTDHNITFHGLRHSYAQEEYNKRIEQGKSELDARLEVSKLLGHERDEVVKIYI